MDSRETSSHPKGQNAPVAPRKPKKVTKATLEWQLEWRGQTHRHLHPSQPGLTEWSISPHTRSMKGYVYILANGRNGTIYIGVTSNPSRRLLEHRHELTPAFTSRYGVKTLVWIERHDLVVDAIRREKAIKKWPRRWKVELIESVNPKWDDVSHWLLDI